MISLDQSDGPEYFKEVNHQGKTLRVGDEVIVNQAGQVRTVVVSSITRKQGHFWVGYDEDARVCPWPLVRLPNL